MTRRARRSELAKAPPNWRQSVKHAEQTVTGNAQAFGITKMKVPAKYCAVIIICSESAPSYEQSCPGQSEPSSCLRSSFDLESKLATYPVAPKTEKAPPTIPWATEDMFDQSSPQDQPVRKRTKLTSPRPAIHIGGPHRQTHTPSPCPQAALQQHCERHYCSATHKTIDLSRILPLWQVASIADFVGIF